MEQEQRGQPLLPIEGVERGFLDLAVNEVESDRLTPGDGIQEDLEEADPDLRSPSVPTSLSVIALNERDLDAADARYSVRLCLEEADVRRQVPFTTRPPRQRASSRTRTATIASR